MNLPPGIHAHCHKCGRSYPTIAAFQAQHNNGYCLPDQKPAKKQERAK